MSSMPGSLFEDTVSLMQARWVLTPDQQDIVAQIARQHDLPEIIARLLHIRGVAPDQVSSYLSPSLARDFPDPLSLKDMAPLAEYLAQAVTDGRKIAVFGDFDVDGATSTALLVRFFRHLGQDVPFYIPDRVKEGYGPNEAALKTLKDQGAEIVILCDCGITAHDVIQAGNDMGLESVILDHHEAEDTLPPAKFVIDPKRRDDLSGLDMLAACGVVFLVCVAVNTALREAGYYNRRALPEAPLKDWLDLVALGTVCDMVPLTGANRLFVRAGFTQMAHGRNVGLKSLCDVARIDGAPESYHAGFVLGPRINAGSRVDKADLGARLLATEDPGEAEQIAWTLEECNAKRKDIQEAMMAHAERMVESEGLADHPAIIVGHEDWHPGLSGLVAGRLKEKYGKPAVVISYAAGENGALEGRGSGRSVPGVNIGACFIAARHEGLVLKGGGHAMAAGFTLLPEKLDDFRAFITRQVGKQLAEGAAISDVPVDAVLSVRGATAGLVKMIQSRLGPFGQDVPEPVFVLPHVRLFKADVVGKNHVRLLLGDWDGGGRLKAVAFRAADTPLGEAMLKHGRDRPFHVAGCFKLDRWNGREQVEMHIHDAAFALAGDERKKAII